MRRHHLVAAGALRHRLLLLALGLLAQLLEELRQRLPQLLHQALDLLVRGALLDGLGQALLGGLQRTLGIGEIAVLDAQGDVPQLLDDAVADRARGRLLQAVEDGAQAEIDLQVLDEFLGLQRQRLDGAGDLQAVARVLDQLRRCSTTARASGLVKRRSGSTSSMVSLRPVWPARSLATSVSCTFRPAQGWSPISWKLVPSAGLG